jgi:hypothetical protein
MNLEKVDRTALKSIIREVLKEDAALFKDVIKEILVENQIIISKEQEQRRERLEKMIREDFEKYEDVFKALA